MKIPSPMLLVSAASVLVSVPALADPPDQFRGNAQAAWGSVQLIDGVMPQPTFIFTPPGDEIAFFGSFKRIDYLNWRTKTFRQIELTDTTRDLSYSPDGKTFVTAEWTAGANLRNSATGEVLSNFRAEGGVGYAKYLESNRVAAYCYSGTLARFKDQLVVWDIKTKEQIGWPEKFSDRHKDEEREQIRSIFSSSGKHLLARQSINKSGWDVARAIWVTDPNTNRSTEPVTLNATDEFTYDVSPDGKTALVVSPNLPLRLIDLGTGKVVTFLGVSRRIVAAAAFSPDGKRIVTATGTTVRFSQAAPSFAPDANAPTEIAIWDVASGKSIASISTTGKPFDFRHVAFSPDGKIVAAMTHNGATRGDDFFKGGKLVLWGQLGERPGMAGHKQDGFELSDRLDQLGSGLAQSAIPVERKVELLYVATLGRLPTFEEAEKGYKILQVNPPQNALAQSNVTRSTTSAEDVKTLLRNLCSTQEFRDYVATLQSRVKESVPKKTP